MLRFGRISEVDADKALVKVSFGEDSLVSEWIPTVHAGTSGDSYFHTLSVNTQVAVAMDRNMRYGCVIGAIYSRDTTPSEAGDNIISVVFDNGDKIVIDKQARTLTCNMQGGLTINGDLTVNGSIDASVDVTAGPLNTSLTGHVHVVAGVQTGAGSVNTNPPT